jgi:hypothetical protein
VRESESKIVQWSWFCCDNKEKDEEDEKNRKTRLKRRVVEGGEKM